VTDANYSIGKKEKGEREMKKLMRFLKGEEGLVAIEYGIIAVGIAIAIVVIVAAVGTQLVAMFQLVINALTP
jgi:pilus assembly protein Flp/PilA